MSLEPGLILEAEQLALGWLKQAHIKANYNGFCHSKKLWLPESISWEKPYPETTGYLIENFLRFNNGGSVENSSIGLRAADWLCEIQASEGYFFSGVKFITPSAFNTSQVLFGLMEAHNIEGVHSYKKALDLAIRWLLGQIGLDGKWESGLYRSGYFASYYSRAIWPLLCIEYFPEQREKATESLDLLWENTNNYYSFKDWGFNPSKPGLSHTIAYTIEGFIESGVVLNRQEMINYCLNSLEVLCKVIKKDGRLAAKYNTRWQACSFSKCVTGQAQIISLLAKAFQISPNSIYKSTALTLMEEMINWQIKLINKSHNGAFPASMPIYGAYFPFRYVNWTNKFFLDACYQIKKVMPNWFS
ncbi:MAG: hypothetical protein KA251_00095 [Saprospiraceae bacterium]|nr:hypothetical protein [Candidatus Vicinibacter affinis]MBP6171908.1 hypothetical protein [Saprospiraceae bacterium]MBK6573076.1 hypothetical protein [Candidatus Vicinibacter affinis]MBK6822461.1 hypothetical protein [Candidatus Vicinibacter affinis]MBK7301757.1 hypothetical protein [Candidatus Vicinibacter affinis]